MLGQFDIIMENSDHHCKCTICRVTGSKVAKRITAEADAGLLFGINEKCPLLELHKAGKHEEYSRGCKCTSVPVK